MNRLIVWGDNNTVVPMWYLSFFDDEGKEIENLSGHVTREDAIICGKEIAGIQKCQLFEMFPNGLIAEIR